MIWKLLAFIASRPAIANWLIERAQRTPYEHIQSLDGNERYMGRWWLFNPYPHGSDGDHRRIAWLPSVRIHHICREDQDRHLHDHPWNARTIILRGWYNEERPFDPADPLPEGSVYGLQVNGQLRQQFFREHGYTGRLLFGQYHRITAVSPGGVWTLFIVGRKRGTWGFQVDGKKVPWREYLGLQGSKGEAA